jgi:tellurium resistance protein TerD
MSIVLKKNSLVNLTKSLPLLKKCMIGLGWELKTGQVVDLDASAFMLSQSGKLLGDEWFIFYNNLKSPDGSTVHTGDNRTGIGDDDDEMILVNLPLVNEAVTEILITVSIHDAIVRRQNFGTLSNAYIRLVDVETKQEVLKWDLDEEFTQFSELEMGKLLKKDNQWFFQATGIGSNIELGGLVNKYQ